MRVEFNGTLGVKLKFIRSNIGIYNNEKTDLIERIPSPPELSQIDIFLVNTLVDSCKTY